VNELAGRVAIVTGAARGVGAAIVRELIARGAPCSLQQVQGTPPNGADATLRHGRVLL
jgi:NAD(P)-dependent dehydrogenase (short-subunit alcohol dehydrogenase family)